MIMEMIFIFALIQNLSKDIEEDIIKIRRKIHSYPELSLKEINTSRLIVEKLKEYGINEIYDNIYETTVMAIIRGNKPGRTVLLRADMDALPIEELNDLEYKSKIPGVMHACGHDSHVAWLLGAAYILNKIRDSFTGVIKILFQPAEEDYGGADVLLKNYDLLNIAPKVDIALACHAWPNLELGKFGVVDGMAMAASNKFCIKVIGKGGHGAQPNNTIDPIAISVSIYSALQNIISRRVSPFSNCVLTIGNICCEGAYNVIPDTVEMEGTIRCESYGEVVKIMAMAEKIIQGIAASEGGRCEVKTEKPVHAVINNKELVYFSQQVLNQHFNKKIVEILKHGSMTGEDFCYFSEKVPSLFMYVGTKDEKEGLIYGLHNARFNLAESIIAKTAEALSVLTVNYLNSTAN